MPRYNPAVIEPKWQRYWEEHRTFAAPRMPSGEKLYVLDMFPYPSGDGLHVGHPEGYTATDIVCRFARMQGKSVMHPMGFDAFGLPAEEAAINKGIPPRESTEKNIANFRRQLKMLGFSFDWDRELATTDPDYFKWTQWIFLVLFDTWFDADRQRGRPISELPIPPDVQVAGEEAVRRYQDSHRLAYQHEAPVNWCPALGTVLANEEVQGGVSERGHHPVVRLPLRQWMLRITAYANRLEKDLELVDWPASIKKLQSDWIGRSTGAEVDFYVGQASRDRKGVEESFNAWKSHRAKTSFPTKPDDDVLRIYTTRPDTLFGATYMVIAPEHPFVERLTTPEHEKEVRDYCEQASRKSDLDRTELSKTKTGVFTGLYAINPVNDEAIPIWIADYVLISYGTGAIMAVPAHDYRDFEFAKAKGLSIERVILPQDAEQFRVIDLGKYANESNHFVSIARDATIDAVKKACGTSGAVVRDIHQVGEDVEVITQGTFLSPSRVGLDIRLGFDTGAYTNDGICVNSSNEDVSIDGLRTSNAQTKITEWLSQNGLGVGAVNYKLRDWLFSRQRFWGEPFPILHELDAKGEPTGLLRAVPVEQLPVNLPELADFKPLGEPKPPLEKAPAEWLYVTVENKAEGGRRKADSTSPKTNNGQGKGRIVVSLPCNVRNFSEALGMPASQVLGKLLQLGWGMPNLMSPLDQETVELLAREFGVEIEIRPTNLTISNSPLSPGRYKRETNTMPQWAGSCWYYLRFLDNKNDKALIDPQIEKAWMPVDLYIGGAEHAVLHLLYSRFWHKVLFDRGYVTMPEPFMKLVNQGMILGEMEFTGYRKAGGGWLSVADVTFNEDNKPIDKKTGQPATAARVQPETVEKQGDTFVLSADPKIRVDSRAYKMSKSRGNVVNPDVVVREYGTDALRLYEMFMGPLEATKPWSMTGVNGVRGFLDRVWRLIVAERSETLELNPSVQNVPPTDEQNRVLHKTIAAVTADIQRLDFNTAIARMMEFTNFFTKQEVRPREAMEKLVLLLSPFAPHMAEELWQLLGHEKTLAYEPWPKTDDRWLREDTIEVPVQVNGKLRGKMNVPAGSDQATLEAAARADERIAGLLAGKTIIKTIVVPGRLVNFVVK